MEAVSISETSVNIYQATRRYIPEVSFSRRRGNLKFYQALSLLICLSVHPSYSDGAENISLISIKLGMINLRQILSSHFEFGLVRFVLNITSLKGPFMYVLNLLRNCDET
jgi:hypothetical protein